MEKLRKAITVSVMMMTVLSMTMLAVPMQVGAAASAGDLIKMDGLSSVYYLGGDGKRYVFPNEQTYFSWYSDFSSVVTIPQSELESYSLGANVTIRPGTKLVKITTDPKVYAVESDGKLKHISDEATAIALYGANWAKKVVDVPDAFFTNYTVASGQVSSTAYPEGSLIKKPDSADVYYVASDGKARKVGSEASFLANRFKWDDIITTSADFTMPAAGTDLAAADSNIIDTSSGAGGVAGAGTGLTVSLAGTTAPSSTLVATQANASLASFNLTAANDGAVKVTSIKVKRLGVSADATLSAVYLYDGTTRLTDSASISSGYATWNNSAGIITVPAGTTKTLIVKSNILTGTSGQTVSVGLEAATDVTTDGAAVSGTFPMNGNLHSIALATLADVSFGAVTPTANTSVTPQNEFVLWQSTATVGTRSVDLEYITFRQIGSVLTDDLQNFKLFIDGVQKGSTVVKADASGYVTFAFATKERITAAAHEFKVLVDIIGGSSRTASLSLQRTSDASFIDTEYNVPTLIEAAQAAFSAQSSGTQTISAGNLTFIKKTTSPTGNVVKGASTAALAAYELKASGENMKVESLRFNIITSDANIGDLRNGKIYAGGVQIGSTADLHTTNATTIYTEYTFGSSLIVKPGTPVLLEVKADVYDSDAGGDNTSAGDTVQIQIASTTTSNVQRMTSLTYAALPATDVAANSLTVQTGTVSCSRTTGYTNRTITVPQTAYKIAEFACTANTTENINLTTLAIGLDNTAGFNSAAGSMFSDVYLNYGGTESAVKNEVASTTFSGAGTTITGGNSWTVNKTLAKNSTITVAVYSNLSSSAGTGTINADLLVAYTTAGSATSGLTTEADGQTITVGTGSLTTAATEDPLDQVVFGNQTVVAANYEISASNETYTVEEIAVKFMDANVIPAVSKVYLYDGETVLNAAGTEIDSNGYATTTGLSLAVSGTKTITVKLALNSVGTNAAAVGLNASTTLDTVVARNSQGTVSNICDDRQGNTLIVYKTYPVVTQVALSSAERQVMNNSSQAIYKFTVTPSSAGSVGLKQFSLGLTWTDLGSIVADLELESVKLYRGTTDITSYVTISDEDGSPVSITNGATEDDGTMYFAWATSTEEQISAATTYTVKATPKNFDSGTTSSDAVSIILNEDTSASGAERYLVNPQGDMIFGLGSSATDGTATAANFIWSDRSSTSHSNVSGSSSADWANGYLIDNLPLDSTVMEM